ncbi:MAG: SDR family NAD(P)-dependent oxidoreductase [Acidimicrobiia bacterium]
MIQRAMLDGKRALVTGASRNLGAVVAARLGRGGATVAVNYHTSPGAAEELVDELRVETGRPHLALPGDMGRPDAVRGLVAAAVEGLAGPIDVLVNNVGPFAMTPFAELAEEEWDRIWDSNVKAAYLATQAVVPAMRRAGWGRIVNLSAVSAYVRNRSIYGLAKSAIVVLTEELALELGPEITVNAVAPGQIVESLEDIAAFDPTWADRVRERTPAGRLVTRDEVAEVVYRLCTPMFDMVTGVTIPLDGGLRLNRF